MSVNIELTKTFVPLHQTKGRLFMDEGIQDVNKPIPTNRMVFHTLPYLTGIKPRGFPFRPMNPPFQ